MKNVSMLGTSFLLITAIATTLFFSACKKDCPEGFEGDNCDINVNSKFLGEWDVFDECSGTSHTYDLTITPQGSSKTEIMIDGFLDAIEVPAIVSGNTFTIIEGEYSNTEVTGSGTISSDGKTITAVYTGVDQFVDLSCTGTWTKQ